MSKEKQKFFRSSAFNKKQQEKSKQKPTTKKVKVEAAAAAKKKKPSSSSECSGGSSDSDTDSSVEPSNSGSIKIPSIFTSNTKKMETFGSISGITMDKDKPWGFAVAAAEAKRRELASGEPLTFESFKNQTFSFDGGSSKSFFPSLVEEKSSSNSSDKTKPGCGQLRGLFDGLSHLFAAATENRSSRAAPNYNPNRRPKNPEDEDEKGRKRSNPAPPPTEQPKKV